MTTTEKQAAVAARMREERQRAISNGHALASCGASFECWRCGKSGTVHATATGTGFVGSLSESTECNRKASS